jgi:hypothetical protein
MAGMESGEVEIELLGVARLLAAREYVSLPLPEPPTVAGLWRVLATEIPALVGTVLAESGEPLGGHVLARRSGELLQAPDTPVHAGDQLLLFTLAAGG